MSAVSANAMAQVRDQFPALKQNIHGAPLAYLDSAATTQRPQVVLDAVDHFYESDNANVHRGVHTLSQRATDDFDNARRIIQSHINAAHDSEIIFTKGCTESINLVAQSWGRELALREGDIVLLSTMEHHANIVPWQIAAERVGATVKPIPIFDTGELDLAALERMLDERVKLVGIKHVCNALGTINPVANVVKLAQKVGARVLVDGAQALAHQRVDVVAWDVDFYSMSSHKVYGPMGVGALFAKKKLLEEMPPYQSGGDMIKTVTFEKTTFNDPPNKFEPGTPNVGGVVGFGRALEFVQSLGIDRVDAHERQLARLAADLLQEIEGVRIIGNTPDKVGIVSFTLDDVHPHDVGTVLDRQGIAVRTGHHCCMPLMIRLGIPATTRASFAVYNTEEEVHRLVAGVKRAKEILA